ncbi:hypothetical protein KUTeg_016502, partial [Tegillarca granosa]
MMKEAYPLWDQLERESGTKIVRQSGLLLFGVDGNARVDESEACLRQHGMPCERLNHTQVKERYPMISYTEGHSFLLDPSGGVLYAEKALKAFQDQFIKNGGELRDGEPMIDLFPGDTITVRTNKGRYKTKNIVLTLGPWATKILPTLGIDCPLKVWRINVLYWKEKKSGEYGADRFPTMAGTSDHAPIYVLPSDEYPGHVKICLHHGPEIDPDNRDDTDDGWVVERVSKYVKNHFPGLIPIPSINESCIYTMTPDEDFILDTHPTWKNIIIGAGFSGAGIEGSATAYHLAKNEQKTLLLEQFPLPHSRGSSHGQSRIIRKAYGTDEHYTIMMKEAYPLWEQLERESNTKLFRQTGMLTFGADGDDGVVGSEDCLKRHKMKYDKMNDKEAKKRYPMLSYPENYIFLLDYSGGILRSDKALKAFQEQFVRNGGELHDGEPVVGVVPGDIITVKTDKGQYKTRAVLDPGQQKYYQALDIDVPLEALRISVLYWKQKQPGEYSVDKFPPMAGTSKETPIDDVDDSWVVEQATQYVKDHFPGLIPVPSIRETCIYTMTPDEDFILDYSPLLEERHGFKLAPVVGKVLAELVMQKSPSYDMKPFRIKRFSKPAKFPLPHSRGSSHGQSRITRKAYGTMEHYTNMMKESYPLWETLEKETGIPFEKFDSKRAKERYPMISYPDNYTFVLDYSGGILRADKALKAFQDQFKKFGGQLNDGEPMIDIFPGDIVTEQYRTKSVVLTVGPWAAKILPNLGVHLPLKPVRITVCYWKEAKPGEYGADKFPVFMHERASGNYHTYGLPSEEYPGLFKLCLHYGPEIDPDNRDAVNDDWVINRITKYVKDNYPGLVPVPSWFDDENFVLDTHPAWKNVIIGAGFSGHGFKLAPVVGKVLAELAMKKPTSYDMTPF